MRKKIEAQARVTETLSHGMFRVEVNLKLENDLKPIVYLSGKMIMNRIKVSVGDIVTVELSPYDLDRGRIIFRNR